MSVLTREISFSPAYDKRHIDPSKDYGIHGVEMRWYVKSSEGAVQFVVYTNWMLPSTYKNWLEKVHGLCPPSSLETRVSPSGCLEAVYLVIP